MLTLKNRNPWVCQFCRLDPNYLKWCTFESVAQAIQPEKSALQAATILVAMASGKNIWWLKFWRKSPIGDLQIKRETYLKIIDNTWRIYSIVQVAASPVFLFSPLVVQKVECVNLKWAAAQNGKFDRLEGVLRTIVNVTRSLLSLSLAVAKRRVENVPVGAFGPRVICHKVSSTSKFIFGDWISFYGDYFTNEGRQKAIFWKSELGALKVL